MAYKLLLNTFWFLLILCQLPKRVSKAIFFFLTKCEESELRDDKGEKHDRFLYPRLHGTPSVLRLNDVTKQTASWAESWEWVETRPRKKRHSFPSVQQ